MSECIYKKIWHLINVYFRNKFQGVSKKRWDSILPDGRDHLKPWFELLHQQAWYFVQSLLWSFWTLSAYKLLKTHAPVITTAGYKFTFWWLPRGWTRPSETSIWNTSPTSIYYILTEHSLLLRPESVRWHDSVIPSGNRRRIPTVMRTWKSKKF